MILDRKVKQKLQYVIRFTLYSFFLIQNFSMNAQEDTIRYRLPEVTITGTRVKESLLEVPLAVTIVDHHQFSNMRGVGLDEALRGVPGIIAQSRAGGTDIRLNIRGFGARGAGQRSNAGTSRGIQVLVDGIPETEPDGRTAFDMIDLQSAHRIEIVRSNASALYGSAAGGVVNIQSNMSFSESFSELGSTFGSFGFFKNYVNLGTTIGENARFITTITDIKSDGWRDHSSSRRSLIHTGLSTLLSNDAKLAIYISGVSNLYHIPGPLTPQQYANDSRESNFIMKQRNERRFNRQGKVAFIFTNNFNEDHAIWTMGFVTPKMLQRSERGTFRDFNRYNLGGSSIYHWQKNFSSNFRNHLSLGFDESYQDGSQLFYLLTPNGDRGDTLRQNKREAANSFGLFLHNEARISPHLNIVVGMRYDVQEYIFQDFLKSKNDATQVFKHVTPKIAISYQFNPNHTVYGNIGGGVETPAFNEVDPPPDSLIVAQGGTPIGGLNPLLKPATSITYEVGTKGLFLANGLLTSINYDLAMFYLNIENDIIPWAGGMYYFTAGRSRRYGLEVGMDVQTTVNLSLLTALTLMDSKYLEYKNDLGAFDGNKTAGIPPFSLNVRTRYTIPSKGFFEVGIEHLSSYIADDANLVEIPTYTIVHASAGYNIIVGSMYLKLIMGISNITNREYVASAYINPEKTSNGYAVYEPGLPRHFYVTFSAGF